jgi:hypothetical protein
VVEAGFGLTHFSSDFGDSDGDCVLFVFSGTTGEEVLVFSVAGVTVY